MTLDALRCLCAIVETRSFRLAALQVHRSQPAVSQQLKALEREFGAPLIARGSGAPTPLGQLVYERARRLLLDARSLQREVEDFDEETGGELRVGTSDTVALYMLPPHVRRFAERMPGTRLVIVNRSSDAIAAMVVRGELDLGIVTLPMHREELDAQALFQQQLVLVLPRTHALAKAAVQLQDLREEPMLLLDSATRTGLLLQEHFQSVQFTPRVVLDSGSFEVIKRYVGEGVGLAILPDTVLGPRDTALVSQKLQGLPQVPIGAIWRRGAYRSKAAHAFLELLQGQGAGGVSP